MAASLAGAAARHDDSGVLATGARDLAATFAAALQAEVLAARAALAKQQCDEWDKIAGVLRSASVGKVKGAPDVVHRMVVGEAAFPIESWTTTCGWKFGYVKHARMPRSEINCDRCCPHRAL